jgi:Ser/Thr protein kinase RdoA (MazF antagonist)
MPDVATLNSVDFRFLLPSDSRGPFEHLALLGGLPGMAERLIETNTAKAVSCPTLARRHADAVVVMEQGRPALRDLAACLQPAGVLYFQARNVPLPGRTRIGTLRQALATVGLELLAAYATRPNSDNPRVYIPLDAPGAVLWYLRTLHWVGSPRSWLLNRVLLSIGRVNPRLLASWVPHVAIVARKPAPEDATVHKTCAPIVADPLLGRALGTTDLHVLLISGQRTIMFLFERESSEPLAVVKIPKLAEQNRDTENGHQALVDLNQQDSPIAFSAPRPLLLLNWRGVSVAVESVVQGQSLARIFDSWRSSLNVKCEELRKAVQWLSRFHRSTLLSRAGWSSEGTARWLTAPRDVYRQMFGETEEERQLFELASGYAASVTGLDLPIVRQHRDFRPENIIRNDRGDVSVVDWEGCRAGPAFCDLLHLVVQWHHRARRLNAQTRIRGLQRVLFDPIEDRIGHVVHEIVVGYLNDLRLPGGLIPLLILYTLVELATRRGEQKRREYPGTDLRCGNENVQFVGALASRSAELFNSPRAGSMLQRLRHTSGQEMPLNPS